MLYLPILLATVRSENRSAHVANYMVQRIAVRDDVETSVFDADSAGTPNLQARAKDLDTVPKRLAVFRDEMARADGFIVVTPEYNHSIPGALKNMVDHLHAEWARKPFGVASTGGMSGGLRAAEAMRQVVGGLESVMVPRVLPVPRVGKAFGPDGPIEDADSWKRRTDGFLDELVWYAEALKAARAIPSA